MRSRRYTVELKRVKKTHAYQVYADRTVEIGTMERGDFVRSFNVEQTRARAADLLGMSRDFGYEIKKEWL